MLPPALDLCKRILYRKGSTPTGVGSAGAHLIPQGGIGPRKWKNGADNCLLRFFLCVQPVSDRLGEVECPTLIVNATDDVLIPLVEQTRLHEGIKNSEMVIIPKCGHASMYEKPMLFSSLVLGWINVKDEDYESIFA